MKWHLLSLAVDEEREHLLRAACLEVERLLVVGQTREAILAIYAITYALGTRTPSGDRMGCGIEEWRT